MECHCEGSRGKGREYPQEKDEEGPFWNRDEVQQANLFIETITRAQRVGVVFSV